MKVFVITYRHYSYPSVIVSSKENVTKWFEMKGVEPEWHTVEEYELDEGLEEKNDKS